MTTTKAIIDTLSQSMIDGTADHDDHFSIIAGIIGNLAQYLADTVE